MDEKGLRDRRYRYDTQVKYEASTASEVKDEVARFEKNCLTKSHFSYRHRM